MEGMRRNNKWERNYFFTVLVLIKTVRWLGFKNKNKINGFVNRFGKFVFFLN